MKPETLSARFSFGGVLQLQAKFNAKSGGAQLTVKLSLFGG